MVLWFYWLLRVSRDKRETFNIIRKNVAEMIGIEDTRYVREAGPMLILLNAANADLHGATILPFSGQLRAGAHLGEAWCAVVDCSQLDRATDRMCPCLSLYVTGMPQRWLQSSTSASRFSSNPNQIEESLACTRFQWSGQLQARTPWPTIMTTSCKSSRRFRRNPTGHAPHGFDNRESVCTTDRRPFLFSGST